MSSDGRNIKDFFTADLHDPVYRGKYTLTVYELLSIYKHDDCVDPEIFNNLDKGRGPRDEFICEGGSRQFFWVNLWLSIFREVEFSLDPLDLLNTQSYVTQQAVLYTSGR